MLHNFFMHKRDHAGASKGWILKRAGIPRTRQNSVDSDDPLEDPFDAALIYQLLTNESVEDVLDDVDDFGKDGDRVSDALDRMFNTFRESAEQDRDTYGTENDENQALMNSEIRAIL